MPLRNRCATSIASRRERTPSLRSRLLTCERTVCPPDIAPNERGDGRGGRADDRQTGNGSPRRNQTFNDEFRRLGRSTWTYAVMPSTGDHHETSRIPRPHAYYRRLMT